MCETVCLQTCAASVCVRVDLYSSDFSKWETGVSSRVFASMRAHVFPRIKVPCQSYFGVCGGDAVHPPYVAAVTVPWSSSRRPHTQPPWQANRGQNLCFHLLDSLIWIPWRVMNLFFFFFSFLILVSWNRTHHIKLCLKTSSIAAQPILTCTCTSLVHYDSC